MAVASGGMRRSLLLALACSALLAGCAKATSSTGGADRVSADPAALLSEACTNTQKDSWHLEASAKDPSAAGYSQLRWSQTIAGGEGRVSQADGSQLDIVALARRIYLRPSSGSLAGAPKDSNAKDGWFALSPDSPLLEKQRGLIALNQVKATLGNCKPEGAAVTHSGGTAVGSVPALQIAVRGGGETDVFSVPRNGPLHIIGIDFSQDGGGHGELTGFNSLRLPQAPPAASAPTG